MFNLQTIYLKITCWLESRIFAPKAEISLYEEDVKSSSDSFYRLTQEQRESLLQELSILLKQNVLLHQSLREQKTQSASDVEDLFLELLEVSDALESLLTYLKNNPDVNQAFIQRLPRSLGVVHHKLLTVLSKHHVLPIELQSEQLDFNLCRVVDRELRSDLEDQTIVHVVRQGFILGEKVLRPMEVITSIKSKQ